MTRIFLRRRVRLELLEERPELRPPPQRLAEARGQRHQLRLERLRELPQIRDLVLAFPLLRFDLLLVIRERGAELANLELEIAHAAIRRPARERGLLLFFADREPGID